MAPNVYIFIQTSSIQRRQRLTCFSNPSLQNSSGCSRNHFYMTSEMNSFEMFFRTNAFDSFFQPLQVLRLSLGSLFSSIFLNKFVEGLPVKIMSCADRPCTPRLVVQVHISATILRFYYPTMYSTYIHSYLPHRKPIISCEFRQDLHFIASKTQQQLAV